MAPLSGEFKELGNSLLYSLQLALDEINDDRVFIIPRDSGFKNKEKLNSAIVDLKSQGVSIIVGPISNDEFKELKKFIEQMFIKYA